jgi:hypothetical protein
MDWIKSQYDRVALAALGLIALASAGVISMQAMSFPESFAGQNSAKPADNTLPQPPTDAIATEIAALNQPSEWVASRASLLVSKPYILKDGMLINPLEGGTPLHPPIPNEWIVQFGLDYADTQLLDSDADNDLFTVIEEFEAGTDPTDPKSKPSYASKLRVREFISERFRLKFSSIVDAETFSVNTIDLKEPTTFIKVGQFIANTKFKLTEFIPKTVEERGIVKDVSELVFENVETGDRIVLPLDQEVNSPTPIGVFVNLLDGQEFRVRRNGEFSISQESDVKYKLIDIADAGAVIQRSDTGKETKVLPENR